jgi:hypothetical protein
MLVTKANGLKLGNPMELTTHMGPVISARQLEILESQVFLAERAFSCFFAFVCFVCVWRRKRERDIRHNKCKK